MQQSFDAVTAGWLRPRRQGVPGGHHEVEAYQQELSVIDLTDLIPFIQSLADLVRAFAELLLAFRRK